VTAEARRKGGGVVQICHGKRLEEEESKGQSSPLHSWDTHYEFLKTLYQTLAVRGVSDVS